MVRIFGKEQPVEPKPEPKSEQPKAQEVIVEREITLSLLNDKLNYIISKINE